jgi:hypothetical protein
MSPYIPLPNPLEVPVALHPRCRATVIIPARNEQESLPRTLDALRQQVDGTGRPLDPACYEVLLLLNNCTDASVQIARRHRTQHPKFALHILTRGLPPEDAHVGTARRLLMDAAYARLRLTHGAAILSTDADTVVEPDWIARNLAALYPGPHGSGADVVGGVIQLFLEDFALLDHGTRAAYRNDRAFQHGVAHLEALLDPDPADPWPRHLEHFGASLACTPQIYARVGGLPPVKPLEDVAFIDQLRKAGTRIRHAPEVRVYTSARLDGRAEVGLSGQLRLWQWQAAAGEPHLADSAPWLEHRFRSMARLRRINAHANPPSLAPYPAHWRSRIAELRAECLPTPRFLELLDCDRLIEETFGGHRRDEIGKVIADLESAIQRCTRLAPARPAESVATAGRQAVAMPAG